LKIFAILIGCVQSLTIPLTETCEIFPVYNPFVSIPECLRYVNEFSLTVKQANTDLYVTGFCTTKDVNET
jgi:hypothetical protein